MEKKTRQVPIPENCKPWPDGSPEEYQWQSREEVEILKRQNEIIRNIQEMLECGGDCKVSYPVQNMYRCLYCGIFFCYNCAGKHFGKTRAEYNMQRREAYRELRMLP